MKLLFRSSVVVCNLYPFKDTISKDGVSVPEAVEQIDIGGCEINTKLKRTASSSQFKITGQLDFTSPKIFTYGQTNNN